MSRLEEEEQKDLAVWLNNANVLWCHVPNGVQGKGKKAAYLGAKLRAMGVRAGVSDVLIFTPAPGRAQGTALELKRSNKKKARKGKGQPEFLAAMKELGWATSFCYGYLEAVDWLKSLGYRSTLDDHR